MEDQLITFETAKLAKEKGFKELCFNFYNKEAELKSPYLENGSSSDTEFRVDLEDLLENYNLYEKYSAPTQSLLAKWLREVHYIYLWCTPEEEIDGVPYWEYHIGYRQSDKSYPTYELTLETGLFEALKLIK